MADSLVAGSVLSQGLPLLTRNRRHYQRVGGLALVDLQWGRQGGRPVPVLRRRRT